MQPKEPIFATTSGKNNTQTQPTWKVTVNTPNNKFVVDVTLKNKYSQILRMCGLTEKTHSLINSNETYMKHYATFSKKFVNHVFTAVIKPSIIKVQSENVEKDVVIASLSNPTYLKVSTPEIIDSSVIPISFLIYKEFNAIKCKDVENGDYVINKRNQLQGIVTHFNTKKIMLDNGKDIYQSILREYCPWLKVVTKLDYEKICVLINQTQLQRTETARAKATLLNLEGKAKNIKKNQINFKSYQYSKLHL